MTQKRYIYADNAATTRMSDLAVEAMQRYLTIDYGNASQPYSFARNPKHALQEAREIIASCIGAQQNEIYFTSGGTESDNWALINAWLHGKRIVTSQIEHHAILNTCAFIERHGGDVTYLPVDSKGIVYKKELTSALSPDCFISIMMANNEIGTIEPIEEFAHLAKDKGAQFHTDAVQAIGHIDIDVKKLGIDMLSASAHKFNGPKGVGFLYVRNGIEIESLIHGGAQQQGKRAGTENVAGIMAMAVALRENVETLQLNQFHLNKLESAFTERMGNVHFVRNGINQLPGLLSLSFEGASGEAILHRLDLQGIAVSTGSACDSQNMRTSHVLKAINTTEELANGTIRISFGKYNTVEDALIIADRLTNMQKR